MENIDKVVLVRYGEIHLKGQNRPFFENMLLTNIKKSLSDFPEVKVTYAQGRIYIENIRDERAIMDKLSRVFGIISMSPTWKTGKGMDEIAYMVKCVMKEALGHKERATFKVESRRSDKKFPLNSMELSREIGACLLKEFPQLKVDVHNPDIKIQLEVREFAYAYYETISGAGGMPVGTNGKATLLLSGGIDSPVAGWMIAKRGVELSAVHYHSFPYTSDKAKEKVLDLARILARYCGQMKVYVVPFTEIQQQLYEKCPDSQLTILMRRFMMKIAESIAMKEGSKALITGESLGQVASQTLDSLVVTDDAVKIPVFRPLIGFDKVEIMDLARKINTYDTSILPYEDCCTIFVPRHPVTHPKLEAIRKSEMLVDGETLINKALENVEVYDI